MLQFRVLTCLAIAVTFTTACARAQPGRDSVPTFSETAIASRVEQTFAVPNVSVSVNVGKRVHLVLGNVPWSDSTDAVQFDRAFDVARLVWDGYGARTGIDTVSIRTGDVSRAREYEYFFYVKQLTSNRRPTLAVAR